MAAQNQGGPNMEKFENYFKRADLDGDGKISGNEAVTFFQGSNLPKHVLAQIWTHADQAHTGFLGRAEFFNALKLVTVAQSKRELTPEIVKAALYGPAAAKIPPPQINLPPAPAPVPAATSPTMRPVAPMPSQNVGFRGQAPMGNNQQYFSSQQSQSVRPPQPLSSDSSFQPPQQVNTGPRGASMASPSVPITNDWIGGSVTMSGPRGVNPPTVSAPAKQQSPASLLGLPSPSDSKSMVTSASASASVFGGDLFSANAPQPKRSPSLPGYSASSTTVASPLSVGPQSSVRPSALDSLQSSFSMQPASTQVQRPQAPQTPVSSQGPSSFSLTGASAATANSSPNNSQIPWPKMKASDVQKYTKVFMEVDTDRDGKITGEQARNLFLSWRLPREVLKQVWDLSDHDSDSMLSLREFCFALYLMERYREGRPLPASLPSNVMHDETLLSMTGLSSATYGNAAWGPSSGFGLQGMPGARPLGPATGVRPVMQGPVPPTNIANQTNQQSSTLERGDSFANQPDHVDSSLANPNVEEASDNEKKVEGKVILDSREKIEFYRSKMQDLVLYKRRCDNKLNEIIERANADKREAEFLGKKYEEKYKQVAEIASKLTIEEATYREIQERKLELQQAIVKMEQGGSADGILQVRADRIQGDLDELMKALTDRCKKHGIDVKPKAMIVLPTGWQPGIPELAAVWDEDWDKFEDEGFSTEITVDGKNVTTSPTSIHKDNASPDNGFAHDSPLSADGKVLHSPRTAEHAFDSESAYAHSEDDVARSPRGSSVGRTDGESPSNIFSDTHFDKASEADPDIHGSFDDSNWGAFDNDDVDSVWGFNTKDPDSSFNQRDSFGSSDFGMNTIRTSSAPNDNAFQNRTSFFDESVPATPMSNFGNSSPRYSEAGDHYFDNNFSRFDSFRTNDSGFYAQPEKLARFDSISSSKDFGHSRAFTSFDDSDPFGSSGPFKVSSDNQTPKKSSDNWNAF